MTSARPVPMRETNQPPASTPTNVATSPKTLPTAATSPRVKPISR